MARIDLFLVRHGEAAAGYADHRDPGLSPHGAQQAALAAQRLAALNLDAPQVLASPLARAQETAAPFAETLSLQPQLEARISEIPAPDEALQARAPWLREVMAGTVEGLPPAQQAWRDALIACLCEAAAPTVFFSHFVAINLAVGAATGSAAMVSFRPGNGSITHLQTDGNRLYLVTLGDEADSVVN
jgi:broad specificity phosphatase PhoE